MKRSKRTAAVLTTIVSAGLGPMLAVAQYRVNNQIYGGTGSVRVPGSIQIPSATYQTPSQVRMAIHASGATPSQLKTEYNRIGPLAPSGAIAYVPPAQNVYAKPAPMGGGNYAGNYVNTQGVRSTPSPAPAAAAPASPFGSFSTNQYMGSIHYAPSSPPSYQTAAPSWSS